MTARVEQIGDATLYLGDCRDIMATLPHAEVDIIWCDPPYGNANHVGDFNSALNKYRGLENQPIINDGLEDMQTVVDGMLEQALRVTKEPTAICCCCGGGGPTPVFAWLAQRMDSKGMQFFHAFIWDKKNPGIGWRFRRQYEFVMVAHRTKGALAWAQDGAAVPNIYAMMPPREREHPNEKPINLMAQFIEWMTMPGQVVLDPFMGSGSTGVAAVQSGRKFIGCELDPKHYETACRRIAEAVKQPGIF